MPSTLLPELLLFASRLHKFGLEPQYASKSQVRMNEYAKAQSGWYLLFTCLLTTS